MHLPPLVACGFLHKTESSPRYSPCLDPAVTVVRIGPDRHLPACEKHTDGLQRTEPTSGDKSKPQPGVG